MRLATYKLKENGAGRSGLGAVVDDELMALDDVLPAGVVSMRQLVAGLSPDDISKAVSNATTSHSLADVILKPPVADPERIICAGLNYEPHRVETGREKTAAPSLFIRWSSSHVGHEAPITKPSLSDQLDFEGEIAVVIGRPGRRISESDAYDHVFGYSCYNDVSVRDWQRHTSQWTAGKNFEGVGGFGPWIVTSDEIGAPPDIALITRLNGEVVQEARSAQMTFTIPELIAYISTFTTLAPGDIIVSGTPGGVGARREPPLFMKPGDIVEVEVERVGILRNTIIEDGAVGSAAQ